MINRHRAPASRLLRVLEAVPNLRAAAFRQSATEIGVERLAMLATSTTAATTLAGLSFNGLDGITATARRLLLEENRGLAFVVDTSSAKEFALAHWLVGGADARRGDVADASLDTSSIAFVLDCHVWSNNSVRVTARNVSASTVDLAAAPLAVQVTKRRLA